MRFALACAALAWICLSGPVSASPKDWKILTHSAEKQVTADESYGLRGIKGGGRRAFYVEVVRSILKELDQAATISNVPLKRGLSMMAEGEAQALFKLVRTPERESHYKWVGPVAYGENYFWESSQYPTDVKSWEQARQVKSICVLNGSVHESILTRLGFSNLVTANSYTSCLGMLIHGRVSLTPASLIDRSSLQEAGFADELIDTLAKTPAELLQSAGYIALSPDIADKTARQWQKALDALKQSGEFERLSAIYAAGQED